jgi:hypothetical protein
MTERCKCLEGWTCERHPEQGWPHDECAGPGQPCEATDCPWWRGPVPAALNTDDWKNLASTGGPDARTGRTRSGRPFCRCLQHASLQPLQPSIQVPLCCGEIGMAGDLHQLVI